MKKLILPPLSALAILIGVSSAQASHIEEPLNMPYVDCSLTGHKDTCLIKSDSGQTHSHIGLHYGTLGTKMLVIEILRAPVSLEKLTQFNNLLRVQIQGQGTNHHNPQYVKLASEVRGLKILVPLKDKMLSSFYISSLLLGSTEGAIEDVVQTIFGEGALAVVTSVGRNP
jgi:hypothetical protein